MEKKWKSVKIELLTELIVLMLLRSIVTSFQVTSFHLTVTSFQKIVTSFHKIVTSFHDIVTSFHKQIVVNYKVVRT